MPSRRPTKSTIPAAAFALFFAFLASLGLAGEEHYRASKIASSAAGDLQAMQIEVQTLHAVIDHIQETGSSEAQAVKLLNECNEAFKSFSDSVHQASGTF